MLAIRPEQHAAFADVALQPFLARLTARIPQWFAAEQATDPAVLSDRVRRTVAQALAHGFTTERLVAQFTAIAFSLGDDFVERFAWAREILAPSRRVSANRRMRLLMARAHEEDGEDLAANA